MDKYCPSHGSEGSYFTAKFCDNCERERLFRMSNFERGGCKIHLGSMLFDIDADLYPVEWIYEDGKPVCTAFDQAKTNEETLDKIAPEGEIY